MDSLFSGNIFVGLSADITDDTLVNIHDQVAASLLYSQEKLSLFAQQASAQQQLVDIFGGNYDATVAESILQSWATGNFSALPQIRVLDAASMPGILGGYADNVVYLNADFLANGNSEQIGAVLLEEFGHWLDSQINVSDAPGDEGELFANRVLGITLTDDMASAIQAENDAAIISSNGQTISLEAATNNTASIISTSSINLFAVDAGWYNQFGYHDPTNSNTYTGDSGGYEYRSFFVFSQPYSFQSGILTGAKLGFYSYTVYTDAPQETLEIRQVDTNPNSLIQGAIQGNAGVSRFNDLGDGSIYGTYSFNSFESSSYFQVALNNIGVSYVQNTNSLIAFGGKLSNLTLNNQPEAIFSSSFNYSNATLTLELNGVTAAGAVTEDINVANGQLSTTGKLAVSDLDPGQAKFSTIVTPLGGNLGALNITEGGTWSYNVNNNLVQSLGAGATRTETFTVKSFDGTASQNININITGVNDAPTGIATASLATGTEDTPYTIKVSDLLSGFSDVDGDPLSVANLTATNGSLVNNNGTYTFTPNANFNGTVTLLYNVIDGKSGSRAGSQSFVLAPVNDPPIIDLNGAAAGTGFAATFTEDAGSVSVVSSNLSLTDVDSAQVNAASVRITNLLNPGFEFLTANTAGTNITVTYDTNVGVLGLSGFDSVANYQKVLRSVTYNNTSQNPTGGDRTLQFSVNDSMANSNQAFATVTVIPVNDAPALTSTRATLGAGTEDTTYSITVANLLQGFTDVDSATLSVTDVRVNGVALTIHPQGNYVFNPPANANGNFTVTYNVTDETASTPASLGFSLTPVNDAAVITGTSVGEITEDATSPNLTATGTLTVNDVDLGENRFNPAVTSAVGNLGNLSISEAGDWSYSVANSAVQFLGAGVEKTETFTVTSFDSTASQDIVVTLTGVNDAATITGTSVGEITEDATSPNLTAIGTLTVNDVDLGENRFNPAVTSAVGNLGNLSISEAGDWSYSVANSAVQFLGAGVEKTETFTVTSFDSTASQDIVVTLTGVNDAATITGTSVGEITEDATSPNLTATGTLTVNDVDLGENRFNPAVTSAVGNLGNLSISEAGDWSYSVANSAVQFLGAGVEKTETFTVISFDSTASQDIVVTLTGVNDAATITGTSVGEITEDATSPNLTAIGTLTVNDVDLGENRFNPAVTSAVGNLGNLSISEAGDWSYSVANSAVQFLGAGVEKTETFTVTSFDSTASQDIVVTLTGVNDAPTVDSPIDDEVTTTTSAFTLDISDNFADVDAGDTLVFTADIVPKGLSFDSDTGVFSSTATLPGIYDITVTATDTQGAFIADTFELIVANNQATSGSDVIFLEALGVNTINALNGDDTVFGTAGNDTIRGNGGNDFLIGGNGNDFLIGGDGDDWLDGGAGSDEYTGGAGADTFVITTGDGFDMVKDFEQGIDQIALGADLSFTDLTTAFDKGKTQIFSGGDLLAELQGRVGLVAGDFVTV